MKTMDERYDNSIRDVAYIKEQLQILTVVTGNFHDLPPIDETLREMLERVHNIEAVIKHADEQRLPV